TVEGALIIDQNDTLLSLAALQTLQRVDGALTLTDNPALPQSEIDALLAAIDALGGPVTNIGNGP
ncbi:MAG: hypothetical protein RL071_1672, partial [Pseudomonadota bacterium]